jgi:hypothetical protein
MYENDLEYFIMFRRQSQLRLTSLFACMNLCFHILCTSLATCRLPHFAHPLSYCSGSMNHRTSEEHLSSHIASSKMYYKISTENLLKSSILNPMFIGCQFLLLGVRCILQKIGQLSLAYFSFSKPFFWILAL